MKNIEDSLTLEERIQDQIKTASIKWSAQFHDATMDLLSGASGLKDHYSKKKVSSLEFLSEERIKKVANTSHRILKDYKSALLKALVREYAGIVVERNKIAEKLKQETSRPWWSRSRRLIKALQIEYHELTGNLKILNGIEFLAHTVQPVEVTVKEAAETFTAEEVKIPVAMDNLNKLGL